MKKSDFLVIFLILALVVTFYSVYFTMNKISDEAQVVKVYYKSIEIYEVNYDKDLDVEVKISSKDNVLLVEIGLNQDGTFNDVKYFQIDEDVEILNIVHFLYGNIHMTEANCTNKLCMSMRIAHKLSTPIFCTNNILIKLESSAFGPVVSG